LIAIDTSVVIAAFASWHEGHGVAAAALAKRPRLPAPVLIESYSVLTRLPAPHTAAAATVEEFLRDRFPRPPLVLPAKAYAPLLRTIASSGVRGGAVYDAVIGATARHANALLLTRDRRASATYQRLGVRFELVG